MYWLLGTSGDPTPDRSVESGIKGCRGQLLAILVASPAAGRGARTLRGARLLRWTGLARVLGLGCCRARGFELLLQLLCNFLLGHRCPIKCCLCEHVLILRRCCCWALSTHRNRCWHITLRRLRTLGNRCWHIKILRRLRTLRNRCWHCLTLRLRTLRNRCWRCLTLRLCTLRNRCWHNWHLRLCTHRNRCWHNWLCTLRNRCCCPLRLCTLRNRC